MRLDPIPLKEAPSKRTADVSIFSSPPITKLDMPMFDKTLRVSPLSLEKAEHGYCFNVLAMGSYEDEIDLFLYHLANNVIAHRPMPICGLSFTFIRKKIHDQISLNIQKHLGLERFRNFLPSYEIRATHIYLCFGASSLALLERRINTIKGNKDIQKSGALIVALYYDLRRFYSSTRCLRFDTLPSREAVEKLAAEKEVPFFSYHDFSNSEDFLRAIIGQKKFKAHLRAKGMELGGGETTTPSRCVIS